MTFADLNLPAGAGYGLWTRTERVGDDGWQAAENTLARAAYDWLSEDESRRPSGMNVFRDNQANLLTLDLIKRAS